MQLEKRTKKRFRNQDFEFAYDRDINLGGVDWDRIVEWCIKNTSKDDIFIDVGAQLGYMSVLVQYFVSPRLHIAIEPDPRTVEILDWNLKTNTPNGNYKIIPKLCLDRAGFKQDLFLNSENPAQNSIFDRSPDYQTQKIAVETTTIDELLKDTEGDVVLKIDAEFSEPLIWKGMQESLPRIKCMIMEVHDYWLLKLAGVDGAGFIDEIERAGFTSDWYDKTNIIFRRK